MPCTSSSCLLDCSQDGDCKWGAEISGWVEGRVGRGQMTARADPRLLRLASLHHTHVRMSLLRLASSTQLRTDTQRLAPSLPASLPKLAVQVCFQWPNTACAMQPDMARAPQPSSSQPPPPPRTPVDLYGSRELPQGRRACGLATWLHGEGHTGGPRQAVGAAPHAPR